MEIVVVSLMIMQFASQKSGSNRLKSPGFLVNVKENPYIVGVNGIHNYMNIFDKLVKALFGFVGELTQDDDFVSW